MERCCWKEKLESVQLNSPSQWTPLKTQVPLTLRFLCTDSRQRHRLNSWKMEKRVCCCFFLIAVVFLLVLVVFYHIFLFVVTEVCCHDSTVKTFAVFSQLLQQLLLILMLMLMLVWCSTVCQCYFTVTVGSALPFRQKSDEDNKLLCRVLNAGAFVVTGTSKFDHRLLWLLHSELHWLDVLKRVVASWCPAVFINTYPSLWHCIMTASTVCQLSTSSHTGVLADCLTCCWSVRLVLIIWQFVWCWRWQRQLQIFI